MDAGYSGKPLRDKLGIEPGMRVVAISAPKHYAQLIEARSEQLLTSPGSNEPFVHIFVDTRSHLEEELPKIKSRIASDGMIWVSWPKKTAAKKLGIETDLTENVIRELALPLGLVDVKVCAVDETWSGLKLVIRKKLR